MLSAREYGASLVFNGQMMVIGGYNDRNGWLDTVEIKVMMTLYKEKNGAIVLYFFILFSTGGRQRHLGANGLDLAHSYLQHLCRAGKKEIKK